MHWTDGRPLAWRVLLNDDQAQRDASRAALSSAEIAAFARANDAPWRITRRLLAKALIAHVAQVHPDDVRIERDAFGALCVVAPTGWHLSLAGQPPFALIALHAAPVGVDIEPETAPRPPDDAFSAKERTVLAALWPGDANRAALVGWVAKEAHGKACGRARQLAPRDIELRADAGTLIGMSDSARTVMHLRQDAGTIAAIAVSEMPA